MIFRSVRNGDIVSFIEDCSYGKNEIVPLSALRAYSFAKNPRAEDDDIVLVLAYKGEDLVGFIGFLPDKVENNNQKKFAWNSGWWVDEQKGNDIAIPLLLYGIQQWNGLVGFIDLPQRSYKILKLLGVIEELGADFGVKFVLRPYLPKKSRFRKLNGVMKYLPGFWTRTINGKIKDVDFSLSLILTKEMEEFINSNQKSSFQRGKEEFDWIKEWPWISSNIRFMEEQKLYPFSLYALSFSFSYFYINNNEGLIAVGVLKERDGHYSIPYLYYKEEHISLILGVMVKHIKKVKGLSLFVHNAYLKEVFIKKVLNNVPRKKIFHKAAFTKQFIANYGTDINWQDGDGDAVFT